MRKLLILIVLIGAASSQVFAQAVQIFASVVVCLGLEAQLSAPRLRRRGRGTIPTFV